MSDVEWVRSEQWDVAIGERFAKRVIKSGQGTGFRLTDDGVVLTGVQGGDEAEVLVPWLDVLDALSDDDW